ncbi:hypothetical protein MHYP_G00299540 [Metynnis hypsauchen]
MEQASSVCGGVSLLHNMVDGKHHYEVKNVLTHTQSKFVRKGDKILMINGVNTKDLPPKEFANMLCLKSPSLTIHQASIDRGINECLECDSIKPYSKEEITLHFRMAMVREECLEGEENEVDPAVCEWESDYTEDDQELLLVSMNETSVAVMSDPENPCNSCSSHGCNISEVVVAAEMCKVTSAGRECMKNHAKNQETISLVQYQRSNTSFLNAPVTIYYYTMLQTQFIGRPVVLELSEINEFLKCTCESQKVVLKSECCDEEQLKKVCKDDKEMLSYVFYMKTLKDSTQRFESAAHRGWFIETENHVNMKYRPEQISGSFYFVISYKSTSQ